MCSLRLYLYRLVANALPETKCFRLKVALLRWAGAEIGNSVKIGSSVRILGIGKLTIGDDVWISADTYLETSGSAEIKIGSHVDIGPRVMIFTGTHEIDPVGLHAGGRGQSISVTIEDGCWLGAGSIILPGATIGSHSIVAAGAVITGHETPARSVLAGVPAKIKKRM